MREEIWLIEDDLPQAEIFKAALKRSGLTVVHLKDGREAFQRLQESAEWPRLLVLDLHLPGLNGDKILQLLRQSEKGQLPKVILATADPRLAETLQDKADLVLLKPISYFQLKELAQRLLAD